MKCSFRQISMPKPVCPTWRPPLPSARRGPDGGEAARRVAQAGRATKARLAPLAVTHRYNRTHCLWLEQFQIADYAQRQLAVTPQPAALRAPSYALSLWPIAGTATEQLGGRTVSKVRREFAGPRSNHSHLETPALPDPVGHVQGMSKPLQPRSEPDSRRVVRHRKLPQDRVSLGCSRSWGAVTACMAYLARPPR